VQDKHHHVMVDPVSRRIQTKRLVLRPWTLDDASAAWAIYGTAEVARWLCPVMGQVTDTDHMRRRLATWIAESAGTVLPLGRWAIEDAASGELFGGVALLPLPPEGVDLEIGWQLAPTAWGHGYGAEAGHAVAHQAFESGSVSEMFAVVRPGNHRGSATARRVGMDWVGETEKYYGLNLQVYRLERADLDLPEPACAPRDEP
jgi:RimJ/RimL family protein N-acetyltransferase